MLVEQIDPKTGKPERIPGIPKILEFLHIKLEEAEKSLNKWAEKETADAEEQQEKYDNRMTYLQDAIDALEEYE